MLDQRAPFEVLTRLRLKRFRLSIDDFGTGHSSLAQLRDISFDELKIDRSFVHGAWRDETARAIYDASLGLGKELGIAVVAEGIEDLDDWNLVRRTRCDLAQGYYIPVRCRPLIWPAGSSCVTRACSNGRRMCRESGDRRAQTIRGRNDDPCCIGQSRRCGLMICTIDAAAKRNYCER